MKLSEISLRYKENLQEREELALIRVPGVMHLSATVLKNSSEVFNTRHAAGPDVLGRVIEGCRANIVDALVSGFCGQRI